MNFEDLATELVLHIFRSCTTVFDVLNLSSTCHRFHKVLATSQRLPILAKAAEAQFGPLEDATQLVTHNASQPTQVIRDVPFSLALLKQIHEVGRVATKWEDIYPLKKWKHNFEDRRLLTDHERYRLRRALYRLWLYSRAFHNRQYPRETRILGSTMYQRAKLLHNWSTPELAEIEDVREVLRGVLQNHICPSNGTIQRKFHKRFPETDHQLLFNIHLNYPPPPTAFQTHFHTTHQVTSANKYYTKYQPSSSSSFELGAEGWGDEIPHYYVVEDMLKLDPGQILWLRENAPLKGQVECFVRALGEWFENNGETFGQTLLWVVNQRGGEVEELREAIRYGELGVVREEEEEEEGEDDEEGRCVGA
ncbi:MAG: hypothetical protein M1827_003475 [Pycnora praestabilis]|nr:MAG: hypothetical protein M1827_003475 [Pycnora praestabilis]